MTPTPLSIQPQHTWALLIGMGEFPKDSRLPAIPAVRNNLTKLRALLTNPAIVGIPSRQVVVIENQAEILGQVIDFINTLPESLETLIVYYVGHGITDAGQLLYLAERHSLLNHPETALPFAHLWEKTLHSAATNLVYLLDCCLSGKALNTVRKRVGKNISVLTATLPNHNALAPPGETYTTFTKHLVELLEGGFGNELTLTTTAIRKALAERLSQGLPKPWGDDFLDTVDTLRIASNRAYRPQSHAIFRIPLPRNEYFTGREDILAQIHDTLPHRPVAFALCGLGGMGKTQVAVEYAYQHQGEYTYVFWLAAHDNVTLQTGVEAIAKDLGLNQPLRPDEVRAWLKEKFSHTPNWLLVVDNADELVHIQQVFKELLPLPLTTGQVLLTTRQQSPPPPLKRLTLDTLTDDQGAELLLRRTHNLESKSSDLDHARTLSHTLQGLPLALAQAAAYIYEMQCSYSHYLTLYEKDAARLLKERGNLVFDDDHPLPVATTWKISIDQIIKKQPRALELLHYCAFLAPTGIPEKVLIGALNIIPCRPPHWILNMKWLPFRLLAGVIFYLIPMLFSRMLRFSYLQVTKSNFDTLLNPILSYSLLTRNSDSQQVRIHSLVQTILRSELGEKKRRELAESLLYIVTILFPTDPKQVECLWINGLVCVKEIQCYQINSEIVRWFFFRTLPQINWFPPEEELDERQRYYHYCKWVDFMTSPTGKEVVKKICENLWELSEFNDKPTREGSSEDNV